ncbi:MAG TPA: hypothetical protein IGS17_14820 [Oscillatoriales cyanobacterium M59_W2019_021]|nr:hypothetical protein [Oscillatoriales cyanobacterium M4454_W2019_049]HIK52178.1 hypothetical protein [Oscillatoriales cyanobacterium M59_W2019_021]
MLLDQIERVMMSRYWKLVRLNPAGGVKTLEIPEAKEFFQKQFPEWGNCQTGAETHIHRQLFAWSRFDRIRAAQLCLRCYISHRIERVCRQLAAQYDLDSNLLLPHVLDDTIDRPFDRQSPYRSLAHKVLETFDPDRAALSTWTDRLVKRHRGLNHVLIEHGIYVISDWAILNDTKPQQLRRIFSDFYHLTAREIQEDCHLLESYQNVYSLGRLQQRVQEGHLGQCTDPTDGQIEQICQYLEQHYDKIRSPNRVKMGLQNIAKKLRDYRIYVRGGFLQSHPIDDPRVQKKIDREQSVPDASPEDSLNKSQFSDFYNRSFTDCIDRSIERVLDLRFKQKTRLKRTPEELASAFHLVYCQGKSQGEIATLMGMTGQHQVSRMLKLQSFRADIRQQLLISLLATVLDKAKESVDPDRLTGLEDRVEAALEEQIETAIPESAKPEPSLFVRRLCFYLSKILPREERDDCHPGCTCRPDDRD